MHKGRYNFTKKRNKCKVTIKSTITKRTISGEKSMHQKRQIWRERERVSIDLFAMNNLERIEERGGNEVKEIYKKIKLEE